MKKESYIVRNFINCSPRQISQILLVSSRQATLNICFVPSLGWLRSSCGKMDNIKMELESIVCGVWIRIIFGSLLWTQSTRSRGFHRRQIILWPAKSLCILLLLLGCPYSWVHRSPIHTQLVFYCADLCCRETNSNITYANRVSINY
jgi:hypothetical protein